MFDESKRKRPFKNRPKRPYKSKFTAEKFWAKITTPDDLSDCWEWTKSCTGNGYGRLGYEGKLILAHRLAWILTFGPIPEGTGSNEVCVLHKCDNPKGCNPNHLFLGTKKDNVDDMRSKGRDNYLTGEAHGSSKLTEVQIREIRAIGYSESSRVLGLKFGVSKGCIKDIRRGRTHKIYLEAE